MQKLLVKGWTAQVTAFGRVAPGHQIQTRVTTWMMYSQKLTGSSAQNTTNNKKEIKDKEPPDNRGITDGGVSNSGTTTVIASVSAIEILVINI